MSVLGMAVDTYLKMLRAPARLAAGRLGGDAAEIALDRADAGLRNLAGALLGDDELTSDAIRRRAAADERERALRLDTEAERVAESGRQRAERRRDSAREQRARRTERAETRARRERLGAAEEKAKALNHTEEALEAKKEAERLGKAAARVKEQRKRGART